MSALDCPDYIIIQHSISWYQSLGVHNHADYLVRGYFFNYNIMHLSECVLAVKLAYSDYFQSFQNN